jgi:hypothetical protein
MCALEEDPKTNKRKVIWKLGNKSNAGPMLGGSPNLGHRKNKVR